MLWQTQKAISVEYTGVNWLGNEVRPEVMESHLASQKAEGKSYLSTPVSHLRHICVLYCASWKAQIQESDGKKEKIASFGFHMGSDMDVSERSSRQKTYGNVFFTWRGP